MRRDRRGAGGGVTTEADSGVMCNAGGHQKLEERTDSPLEPPENVALGHLDFRLQRQYVSIVLSHPAATGSEYTAFICVR